MKNSLEYRLSLGFTILLTLTAFITLLGWLGTFINGVGRLPVPALLPWQPLGLVALTALNCIIRAQFIIRRHAIDACFHERESR